MGAPILRFRDRRAIEAEIQQMRRTIFKMERALDVKVEELRMLERELLPTHSPGQVVERCPCEPCRTFRLLRQAEVEGRI